MAGPPVDHCSTELNSLFRIQRLIPVGASHYTYSDNLDAAPLPMAVLSACPKVEYQMKRTLSLFTKDHSGSISISIAISIVMLIGAVGAAIDYSLLFKSRQNAQYAADSAALSYLKQYLNTNNETKAKVSAKAVFIGNASEDKGLIWDVKLEPIKQQDGSLIAEISAKTTARTSMLHLIGMDSAEISVSAAAGAPIQSISAVVAADVSWSMRGQDLLAVKAASKTFADSMYNMVPAFEAGLNLGVVPYAGSVNISRASSHANRLLKGWEYASPADTEFGQTKHYQVGAGCDDSQDRHVETVKLTWDSAEFPVQRFRWESVNFTVPGPDETLADGTTRPTEEQRSEMRCVDKGEVERLEWSGCLQTRQSEFSSEAQLAFGEQPPIPPTRHTDGDPHCPDASSAMRTDIASRSEFDNYIDGLEVGFSTAHDVGMLWASRLFSPDWASFFNIDSRPWNGEKFPKYLIYLSDGKAAPVGYAFGDYAGRTEDLINENTRNLCASLKSKGVQIFGISYAPPSDPNAVEIVESCASERSHVISDSGGLGSVLTSIASSIKTGGVRLIR